MFTKCISTSVGLENLSNGYKWSTHTLTPTTKEDIINFTNSKLYQVGIDSHFNVPLVISYLGLDCILILKNGERVLSSYNHFHKGNKITFTLNEQVKTFSQIKSKIEKIVFLDDFRYHEDFRQYWTERGIKGEVYKHRQAFLTNLLEGVYNG
jgi:hypothetical protein